LGLADGSLAAGATSNALNSWAPQRSSPPGDDGAIRRLAVSDDESIIAAVSEGGIVSIWNPNDLSEVLQGWKGATQMTLAMALSPDNKHLVIGGLTEAVLNIESGAIEAPPKDIISTPTAYSFSPDSTNIYKINGDYGMANVEEHPAGGVQQPDVELRDCYRAIHLTSSVLTCATDNIVHLLQLPAAAPRGAWFLSTGAVVTATAATPDGSVLVSENMFSFTLKAWRGIILP